MDNPQRRKATIWIILTAVAGLIGWDVYVAAVEPTDATVLPDGQGATISEIVKHAAEGHPAIALALGILCGHLFWSQIPRKPQTPAPGAPAEPPGGKPKG